MLTAKQQQTYQFIRRYFQLHGFAPTEREIAEGIGIKSRGVVHRYVKALEEAGLVKLISGIRRNIRIVSQNSWLNASLPILGQIKAGHPIELIQESKSVSILKRLLDANYQVLEASADFDNAYHVSAGDYMLYEVRPPKQGDVVLYRSEQALRLGDMQTLGNGICAIMCVNNVEQVRLELVIGVYVGVVRLDQVLGTESVS